MEFVCKQTELSILIPSPESLHIRGESSEIRHFLPNRQQYNLGSYYLTIGSIINGDHWLVGDQGFKNLHQKVKAKKKAL